MSYTIAVAGKGGTGKTTLAGLIVNFLSKKEAGPILAVDADPNSNLGEYLGLGITDTLVGIMDEISAGKDNIPPGMTKERLLEYRIQESLSEGEGFDLLVMGRPEGPGCYCYPNSMIREIVGKLNKGYKYVVMDNEAGMEHLSRRTTRNINYLFITSEPTEPGIRAAKRILDLIGELKILVGKKHLIINKAESEVRSLEFRIRQLKTDYIDFLPSSDDVYRLSKEGRPVTELAESTEFARKIQSVLEEAKKRWH